MTVSIITSRQVKPAEETPPSIGSSSARRERANGYDSSGVLKRAALVAIVLAVVGCEPMEETDGPEPIKRHLVYEKVVGETGLWIAEVDGTRPRLLVRDGQLPVVSPDGKLVAYFAECRASSLGCAYVVSASGGEPRLLSTTRLDEAVRWSPTSENDHIDLGLRRPRVSAGR